MKVLVTGASSYVGARIYSDLKEKFKVAGSYNRNQLFPELRQLDITQREKVLEVISAYNPDVIVHVAAIPNPAWSEQNPELARAINEFGTESVVMAADRINARVIYVSTIAAITLSSVYGQTKLAGEEFVKNTKAGYMIFRPSLIIGGSPNTENDRPHNRILWNITKRTKPIYDISWKFQPSWLGHLSECIDIAIERNLTGETIPVAVPEMKSRYDIAHDILKNFGIEAIPVDKKDKTPSEKLDLSKLGGLHLPQYSYEEVIARVVDELREQIRKF